MSMLIILALTLTFLSGLGTTPIAYPSDIYILVSMFFDLPGLCLKLHRFQEKKIDGI